ncbi:hypothetical protein IFM89_009286 [Coptis chinensis]|uniref:protein-serine/threonine phosphatase n=1 Tax=Coptis chinensis TaxID=261450 RepID=A0A835M2I7_9MAGN|nr:hypothetical protein IFM89_009286 [Coptis chinensis]
MMKTVVYQGNSLLGEVEIYIKNNNSNQYHQIISGCILSREIRITKFSQPSERCTPLAVFHTITGPTSGLCFKMESVAHDSSPLFVLHSTLLRENKTAVMPLGEDELHLVAMPSRRSSCFWGFIAAPGLYNCCLNMLNLRCLGIVFDLDETLIVANTMRSFEDRIESLQRKITGELDAQRLSGMLAEIKRYQDDKNILKQYVDSDQVIENGKVVKVQSEIVPPLSEDHQPIVRPIIRLREKNIILTRINPLIRDTSVLVRLRPAWEDLRSYLTARGRKRFEVYVCTMAERDYALEMWRLLDPDSNLIISKELLDRIVCVKAGKLHIAYSSNLRDLYLSDGSRKSLHNVFHDGICHPKMALVIDDRLKVWDEKDQPRVHVVPAFAPYYAPQAEAANVIPVLCVARNVACNVRGGFFKDFDEGLLQKICEVSYEDDLTEFSSAPDVSNYLTSEDDIAASSKDPLGFEGMADVEAERRLKDAISVSSAVSNLDPRHAISLQPTVASASSTTLQQTPLVIPGQSNLFPLAASSVKPLSKLGHIEPSLQCSPAREEGEVPESELDPDTRRRLLILQHGQDNRDQILSEPPFPTRPTPQVSVPPLQVPIPPTVNPRGGWPSLEEKGGSRQLNQALPKPVQKELPLESEPKHFDKHRARHPPFFRPVESPVSSDRYLYENQRLAHRKDDRLRPNHSFPKHRSFSGEDIPLDPPLSNNGEHPAGVLQNIARKCRTMVEFKPALVPSTELQFSVEVWFTGEKIGEGIGKTRREAQFQAADHALRNLANKYLSNVLPNPISAHGDLNMLPNMKENGFLGDTKSSGYHTPIKEDLVQIFKPESSRFSDPRPEGSKRLTSSVSALKELCTVEGLSLVFQDHSVLEEEFHAQVEIGGQVLGKSVGLTWDEAKMLASEEALGSLKAMIAQGAQNHAESPRSLNVLSSKRQKLDFPQVLQRIPSSLRYSNNTSPVL